MYFLKFPACQKTTGSFFVDGCTSGVSPGPLSRLLLLEERFPTKDVFLRFMRRGLISNGPFSSREDITIKPIFYSISPALLWCLMLLRFRLQGHSLDCSSSICFYFLYCTTYLALSDIMQVCFSGLVPKSFFPFLLCLVLVLFQATCFQPYQHSLLFLHTCFSCHTFLILGRPA